MIPKISTGKDFKGCLDYLFDRGRKNEKIVEFVASNCSGITEDKILPDILKTLDGKPEIKNPLLHISLSAAAEDGEISREEWYKVVELFREKMGLDDQYAYACVRHRETDHDHVHLAVSRIPAVGRPWRDSYSHRRAIAACRQIEEELGFTVVVPGTRKGGRVAPPNKDEKSKIKKAKKDQKHAPVTKVTLQKWIDEILAEGQITASQFVRRMAAFGVMAKPNLARTGRLNGFSFRSEEQKWAFKGTELGSEYKLAGLMDKGLIYNPRHDYRALCAAAGIEIQAPVPRVELPAPTAEDIIRGAIDYLLQTPISADNFVASLKMSGVDVKASLAREGRLSGFSFCLANEEETNKWIKGSALGKDYRLTNLLFRGLKYDQMRNHVALKQALDCRPTVRAEEYMIRLAKPINFIQAAVEVEITWTRRDMARLATELGLLYWPSNDGQGMAFWTKTQPGGERSGIAFIDYDTRLSVPIIDDERIIMALKYAREKWGTILITGDNDFILRAEALARDLGIPLAGERSEEEAQPDPSTYWPPRLIPQEPRTGAEDSEESSGWPQP
jgi:hypothetical protein